MACLCSTALMGIMYRVNGTFVALSTEPNVLKLKNILPTINVVLPSKILLTHKEHCCSYGICDRP